MDHDFKEFGKLYIDNWVRKQFKPLLVFVDKEQNIVWCKGEFEEYGLQVEVGKSAVNSFEFLDSLLPLTGESLDLDCIQTPNGRYVGVTLMTYKEGVFAFFHDVTKRALEIQEIQQNRNELSLTMNRIKDLIFQLND